VWRQRPDRAQRKPANGSETQTSGEMKHRFSLFVRDVRQAISFKISAHTYASMSKLINIEAESYSEYKLERHRSP